MLKYILFFTLLLSSFVSGNSYASSSKESEEGSSSMEYVKMSPLILPVIDNDGVSQIVNIVVVIEVDGINNADKVKEKKPRLNDAYIQDMYGILNEHQALKNGIVQVGLIKERLNRITNHIVGDDVHAQVLLQVVQQRPI